MAFLDNIFGHKEPLISPMQEESYINPAPKKKNFWDGWFGNQELLNPVLDPVESYKFDTLKNIPQDQRKEFEKGLNEFVQDPKNLALIYQKYGDRPAATPTSTPIAKPIQTPSPTTIPIQPTLPPMGQIRTNVDPKTLPTYNNPEMLKRVTPYVPSIKKSSQAYGVPPQLLAAALWRESAGFDDKYIHSGRHTDGTGRGIAGIDAVQRADVPDEVAYNPDKAIDWMAKTLKAYYEAEGNDWQKALRRYNGGPNYNANRRGFNGEPVSKLTQKHADYIIANSQNLDPLFK